MPEPKLVERLRTAHEWCSGYEPSWSLLLRDADEAAERIERLETLVAESLYHLRLDRGAKAYHDRALAALSASNEGE